MQFMDIQILRDMYAWHAVLIGKSCSSRAVSVGLRGPYWESFY